MFKKLVWFSTLFLFLALFTRASVLAQEKKPIYFFWSKTCPHCAREEIFLNKLADKYPQIEIRDFEISSSQENLRLLKEVGERLSARGGVPFTVVGKYHFVGFLDDQTTGREIEKAVECYLAEGCQDVVAEIIDQSSQSEIEERRMVPETLDLPLIGEVRTANFSLPVLTLIIAGLDGFNPCAMWVLLFLIFLLLGMKDRLKMWVLGTTFIVASGLVYFIFMTAWLNLFLVLGFSLWVRVLLGSFALGAGIYSLRDFMVNKEAACKTVGDEKRQKIFNKMRVFVGEKRFLAALGGMVILAALVNVIELACSAGLPAIYTQILALANLPRWQHYAYLVLYIIIFMLDDLVVFIIAMVSMEATGVSTRYTHWARLVSGLIMLAIGASLLFKPEWLMFG